MDSAQLRFETLAFEKDPKAPEHLKVILLKIFYCYIPLVDLEAIGSFTLEDRHTLRFAGVKQHRAETKFAHLLEKYIAFLHNTINNRCATYVHRNSGIPLLGNVAFGIVYRNSSLIEIKPVTSCNLSCIYCSVKEGKKSGKDDFVVEKDYLIEELDKMLDFVAEPVEIHIGVQGEPFLYGDMLPLLEDLQSKEMVKTISMDTNFTLVTKRMIDKLTKISKLQLNISLDAMNKELAEKIANSSYNMDYVLDLIRYIAQTDINYIIAPVYVPGYNDEQLPLIIDFVKSLPSSGKIPRLGIQNYLPYKSGRRPIKKEASWDNFYAMLEQLEQEKKVKLKLTAEDFDIHPTKVLEKPFVEGDEVVATIVCKDRFPHTVVARAKNRSISVPSCDFKKGRKIRVKITRDKHNIFVGKYLGKA